LSQCQNSIKDYSAPEKNIDYPGNDIKNFIVANANACAAECDKPDVKNCVGFIYYDESFSGIIYNQQASIGGGSCYLKSSMKTTYQFPDHAKIYAYKSSLRSSANKIYVYLHAALLTSMVVSSYSLFFG